MEVYLLRHASAEQRAASGRDADRALTAAGIAELRLVLDLARQTRAAPSAILASPYVRAIQTAEIAAEALDCSAEIVRSTALQPESSPQRLWDEIRSDNEHSSAVLVVAHEPLLSSAVAWLLGSTREMVRLVPAAMARIDVEAVGAQPAGVLRWLIAPEVGGGS
jgi:phosphohistidine phosphatase